MSEILISRRSFLGVASVAPFVLRTGLGGILEGPREGLARDGVTDDFPAFAALLKRGSKSIYLPGGPKPYCFDLTNQAGLVFPDEVELWGDADTTIELKTEAPGQCVFANLFGNKIKVHDLNIVGNFTDGTHGWVFSFAGERGQLRNIRIDLRNREVSPTKSLHTVAALYPSPNRSSVGWEFADLEIDRTQRAWFRGNEDRAEHNDLVIRSCLFQRSFTELFVFNSPASAVRHALVTDCRFEGNPLISRPVLLLGMTGTRDSVVRRCTFSGVCKDAIHIEEDTENLLVENCRFDVLGNGVAIMHNNVGGKPVSPLGISVRDNRFQERPASIYASRGRAIRCVVWDRSGSVAARSVSVCDNRIDGFEIGIDLGDVPSDGIEARGNIIENCQTAVRTLAPSPAVSNNTMRNCDIGLLSHLPGTWGEQAFQGCREASSVH